MCICELMETTYFSDLSIAVIGAGIGILGSLFIFRQTIENDKIKKESKHKHLLRRRLLWTTELVKSVCENSKIQAEEYFIQGEDILINPYAFHYVKLIASNNLDRIQKVDSQLLLEAFLDRLGDNVDTVNKYKDFINKIDFVFKLFNQTFDSLENHRNSFSLHQSNVKSLIDKFYTNYLSLEYSTLTHPSIQIVMAKYWPIFQNYIGTGLVDIQKMNNEFFVPLFQEVKSVTIAARINSDHIISEIRGITVLLSDIATSNQYYAINDAMPLKGKLKASIDSLLSIVKELEVKSKVLNKQAIDDIVVPAEN